MKINLHSPIEEVQIQIIPLIDVIFCILTFFLLAALQFTRQQAINVDLPTANSGITPQIAKRLIVTIDSGGQVYVEQQPVSLGQLSQSLQAYVQQNPNGMMVLNASRSSSYNDVVQVLDTMRQVGGDRVGLSTLPGAADQPAGTLPVPTTSPVISPNSLTTPNPAITSSPALSPNPVPTFPTAPSPQTPATNTSPQR